MPSQSTTRSCGSAAAMNPEPSTPIAIRGTRCRNSPPPPSQTFAQQRQRCASATPSASAATMIQSATMTSEIDHGFAFDRQWRSITRTSEAREDRERQGRQPAPQHEIETEERHFPDQRATEADGGPARDQRHHGRGIRAHAEEGRGDRIDREGAARHDDADAGRNQDAFDTGILADPSADRVARQQHGHQRRDQTAGQHIRQHPCEQPGIAPHHVERALQAIAPEHVSRGGRHNRDQDRGRPVEGTPPPSRRLRSFLLHQRCKTNARVRDLAESVTGHGQHTCLRSGRCSSARRLDLTHGSDEAGAGYSAGAIPDALGRVRGRLFKHHRLFA